MYSKSIFKSRNYILTVLLIALWILGNTWTFSWFINSLKYTSFFNLVILGIVLTALSIQLWRNHIFQWESPYSQFKLYPLLLMLGGEITAIIIKWSIHIPQLTLVCFILGSYGLVGLFINSFTWHKNLILAIITACIIPFSISFSSGLGFPVRVITAHLVADVLSHYNLSAISSHDIILMENGIAQVDLPCSGMKSLWVGTVFLLGATWLENRRLGLHWLLVAIANIFFLIIANLVRVLILVLIIEVWQQRQIAEILHLPLGVIGFIFSGILTWILLQKVSRHSNSELITSQGSGIPQISSNKQALNLNVSWLLVIVFSLGIIGQLKPAPSHLTALKSIDLPPEIVTQTLALSQAETNFFDNPANPLVQKMRFQTNNLSGSMLIVASDTWHSHHPPELCFVGNGFKVDNMDSTMINNSIHARWLSLENGELSATYWFQSSQETTDNFISRIWEDITHKNKTWVLVSILFDHSQNSSNSEVQNFAHNLYQAIDYTLNI